MNVDAARVRELFLATLDLTTEQIGPYLDEACGGDAALREEVLSLLGYHDTAELVAEPSLGGGESVVATMLTQLTAGVSTAPVEVAERYHELGELGVGGCGRVTRAYDRNLRRVVAHKHLQAPRADLQRMLQHEARLLAYLDHPGVVQVFDGADDHYTMRLIEGETLQQRILGGPVSMADAVRIVSRVGETLANAHDKGVLHLDVKPANILLQAYGQVTLIDWGLAQFHDTAGYRAFLRSAGEIEAPDLRGWGGIGGTPSYMPVEQALGEPLTRAADVFALGTVLYEVISGSLPFASGPTAAAVLAKAHVTPRPLAERRADVPARLDALCLRMLAADPSQRPSGLPEVLSELAALSGGDGEVEELSLAPGDVLFREGDYGVLAYQILSGALEVSIQGPRGSTALARRTTGELIGEMAVVSRAPRSATVTAVEPSRVAVITPDRIDQELQKANPLLAKMVRSLSDRLGEEVRRVRE